MRALVFLTICCLLTAAAYAQAAEWTRHSLGGVHVFVRPGEDALAQRIGAMAGRELPRLARALGVASPAAFDVYAYTDRAAFLADTQRQAFTLGVSYSPSGTIRLDANDTDSRVRNTLAHELTHSLITQRLDGDLYDLPTWVNEGIAGQLSEPIGRADLRKIAMLTHSDGVLSLDEMDVAFETDRFRGAAYLQSRSMVAWLEDRHPGVVKKIFARMVAEDETFTQSLSSITDLTLDTWLHAWMRSVPDFMFWLMLMNSPVVYAPLAIILVIVILLRLRKRQAEEPADQDDGKPRPRNDGDDRELEELLPE